MESVERGALETPAQGNLLRKVLEQKGLIRTMRHIYKQYGGIVDERREVFTDDQLSAFTSSSDLALRADLQDFLKAKRAPIRVIVESLKKLFNAKVLLPLKEPSEFGSKRKPIATTLGRLTQHTKTLKWWSSALSDGSPSVDGGTYLECLEQRDALQDLCKIARVLVVDAAPHLQSELSISADELQIAESESLCSEIWRDVGIAERIRNNILGDDFEFAEFSSGSSPNFYLTLLAESDCLSLKQFRLNLRSVLGGIDLSAREPHFDRFLEIIAQVASILIENGHREERNAKLPNWVDFLNASYSVDYEEWWTKARLIGTLDLFAAQCKFAERRILDDDFRTRLRSCVQSDEDALILIQRGALLRLGMVALVAHESSSAQLRDWLATGYVGNSHNLRSRKRSELHRAGDHRSAPAMWPLLRESMMGFSVAESLHEVLDRLRAGTTRTNHLIQFALASKAYAFTTVGKFSDPPELYKQEPKFRVGAGPAGYFTEMAARSSNMDDLLDRSETFMFKSLWVPDLFVESDFPSARLLLDKPRPASEPGDLKYLAGYQFGALVTEAAKTESADFRAVVVPMLTVPLRDQWWEAKGRWLQGVPSKCELFAVLRWLAKFERDFQEVFLGFLPGPHGGIE